MSTIQNSPLEPVLINREVRGHSKHNIIVPIKDSEDFFIVNPLHGSADITSASELEQLHNQNDAEGNFA